MKVGYLMALIYQNSNIMTKAETIYLQIFIKNEKFQEPKNESSPHTLKYLRYLYYKQNKPAEMETMNL